jgi:large subunit ribosomal protein L22
MPAKSGRGGADVPGVKTNERPGTRAVLRHSRISAYKVRQVLDLIRGQDVDRAAETLSLTDREAARVVGKLLASAVANAVHNDQLDAEDLYVSACYADEGATLKRWRPRARGRATRIRKRTSHVTIIVGRMPDERLARRRAQQAASGSHRARRVAGSRRRQARAEARSEAAAAERRDVETESTASDEYDEPVDEFEAGLADDGDEAATDDDVIDVDAHETTADDGDEMDEDEDETDDTAVDADGETTTKPSPKGEESS